MYRTELQNRTDVQQVRKQTENNSQETRLQVHSPATKQQVKTRMLEHNKAINHSTCSVGERRLSQRLKQRAGKRASRENGTRPVAPPPCEAIQAVGSVYPRFLPELHLVITHAGHGLQKQKQNKNGKGLQFSSCFCVQRWLRNASPK